MYLLLFVLILITIYIISNKKTNSLTYALGLVAIILIVCANTHESIEGFTNLGHAPVGHKMGPLSGIKLDNGNSLHHLDKPSYDGLKLSHKESDCGWRHPPCDIPLHKSVDITTPVGDDVALTDDPASYSFPTIDGDPNSPQKLFMFAHNQVSPKCCPSTFSTDRGCVCLTQKQRDLINGRGGNRKLEHHNF